MIAGNLGGGIFPRLITITLPRGGYAVVLVEAYFDESGTHDGSPSLCVAGYIMSSEGAVALAQEWNAVMHAKGLTHFHMKDCAHGNEEFANLPRNERVQTAASCIQQRIIETADEMIATDAWRGLPTPSESTVSLIRSRRIWRQAEQFKGTQFAARIP